MYIYNYIYIYFLINRCNTDEHKKQVIQWLTHDQKVALVSYLMYDLMPLIFFFLNFNSFVCIAFLADKIGLFKAPQLWCPRSPWSIWHSLRNG